MYSKINVLILCLFLLACDQSNERSYQGYVVGENIYIGTSYSGILKNLAVQRGQSVNKGQLLFELDPDPQELVIKQFQADLQQAENVLKDLQNPRRTPEIEAIQAQIEQTDAQIQLAEIRVKRNSELYKKMAVDKDTFDAAVAHYNELVKLKAQYEANLRLAKLGSREEQINAQQAQIISLTAKLQEAKWELLQKTAYAPAQGIIFDTYYRVGEFVGSQQSVLSVLTPENVRLQFYVPVEELARLSTGQEITFLCYNCKQRASATIDYISPEAEYVPPLVYTRENRDKLVFRIKAHLPEFGQFKPGQPVTVFIK